VFFSFRGRMSPKCFQSASSMLLAVCFLPSTYVLLFGISTPEGRIVQHLAFLGLGLAATCPWLALIIKRLQDRASKRSMPLAIAAALALPLAAALMLANDMGFIDPSASYVVWGLVILIFTGLAVLEFKLGRSPGTVGPNRFGPEPSDG
jgi:uncharacterized membrane protein YhaH (DUF805 family)